MKKFLVLYKASEAGFAQAMSSSPEQQQAGMGAVEIMPIPGM